MEKDQVRTVTQEIWAKVLEVNIDGATDFFEVGGHSFMAMKIIALMDEALPKRTPVTLLFDHPRFDQFVLTVAAHMDASASG
jgi:hypothetical protein